MTPIFQTNGNDGEFLESWEGMDLYWFDYEPDLSGPGPHAIGNPIIRRGNAPWDYASDTIWDGKLHRCPWEIMRLPYRQAMARALALAQQRGLITIPLMGGSEAVRAAFQQHGGVLHD